MDWNDYDEIYRGPQHEAEEILIKERMREKMEDAIAHAD